MTTTKTGTKTLDSFREEEEERYSMNRMVDGHQYEQDEERKFFLYIYTEK